MTEAEKAAERVEERKAENEILVKLIRNLAKMDRPNFLPGGVPVTVAAAIYGKGPCFIQEGIRAGWLPIGHMKPGEQKDNFYISPLKLWEDTGFVYTGQSVEEINAMRKTRGR